MSIHNRRLIFYIISAGLALLLVLSWLFPNKVLDTYELNMREEGEYLIPLNPESKLTFSINTGTRPLRGIQPGISKQGGTYELGILKYQVYDKVGNRLLSDNTYPVRNGLELQYVYLPFTNYEKCIGDIRIEFSYDPEGNQTDIPALLMNTSKIEGTQTVFQKEFVDGGLKGYLVYTHDTYPFTYDLKILLCISIAVSMAYPIAGFAGLRGKYES